MSNIKQSQRVIAIPRGTIVLNRYEVLRRIGEGASGTVYACKDKILCNWTVALKVFPPEVVANQESLERLSREVATLQSIQHQHVAKFYNFVLTDAFVGYVMEHIGGGTLTHKLEIEGKLPLGEMVLLLSQICSGVQAIHRVRIIHRDIKPDNILITKEGSAKIADFGVVRPDWKALQEAKRVSLKPNLSNTKRNVTQDGDMVGTIEYICPEYLRDGSVDQRSDLYSVGVIAYEMLTGKIPFWNATMLDLIESKIKREPQAVDQLRPDCPKRLVDFVMKALKRDPDLRHQSVEEMLEDLRKVSLELQMPSEKSSSSHTDNPFVFPSVIGSLRRSCRAFIIYWPVWLMVIGGVAFHYRVWEDPLVSRILSLLHIPGF